MENGFLCSSLFSMGASTEEGVVDSSATADYYARGMDSCTRMLMQVLFVQKTQTVRCLQHTLTLTLTLITGMGFDRPNSVAFALPVRVGRYG